eukprot:2104180-Amphidinium_carterae.1
MHLVSSLAVLDERGETWASSFYIPSIFPLAGETSCMDAANSFASMITLGVQATSCAVEGDRMTRHEDTRDLMSGLTSMKQGFTER